MLALLGAKVASFAAGVWGKILLVGAIVGTVALILLRVHRAGRLAERAEQAEKINAAVKEQVKTDASWRALPSDERRKRLREQRDELRRLLRAQ